MKQLILFVTFLATFAMNTYADHPHGTVVADVDGLVCDFCARAIEKVFKKKAEVESIDVNLDDKVIIIHMEKDQRLADETIREMIVDSGYSVRELRHE